MSIFRYYKTAHGLSVLNDLELRASIASSLNDPFELSPNIDPAQFSQRRIRSLLAQRCHIDEAYRTERHKRRFANKKQFKRWYLQDLPRRAAAVESKIPKNIEEMKTSFAVRFDNYWRLICASKTHESVLMWSHYADNHSGLVIGFDTDQAPFSEIPADCQLDVTYSNDKPNYVHSKRQYDFQKMMFAVATTKARDWSYEREVRIIVADTAIRRCRFLPLSPKSVAAIYCGCRISPADKAAVRTALAPAHFGHVKIFHAKRHASEYRLDFVEVI